jgi:hypothetical protein
MPNYGSKKETGETEIEDIDGKTKCVGERERGRDERGRGREREGKRERETKIVTMRKRLVNRKSKDDGDTVFFSERGRQRHI